jgi:hypothetical protein
MSQYRIYVLNSQERVARSLEVDFPADRDALAHAEDARAGHYAAEVWDGERLVGRLGGEFSLAEDWGAGAAGRRIISGY